MTVSINVGADIVARAQSDLQQALLRAEQARARLSEAEAEASDLQAFLRTLERYTGQVSAATMPLKSGEHGRNRQVAAQVGTRGRELVDASIATIKNRGAPVKIGELLDAVLAAGLTLGGSDQKSNLAGYLSRDPRIFSRGRSIGWDLVETEGAATVPDSEEAAPSNDTGGTNDRPTLAFPDDVTDLTS